MGAGAVPDLASQSGDGDGCCVAILVVLLPSTAKDLAMIEGRKEKSEVKRSGDC